MTQEAEIAQLKKQLSELVERFSEVVEQLRKAEARESQLLAHASAMQAENQALHEQLATAQQRIEELETQKTPPPAFAKANVKKKAASEKKPRKKREAQHNHGRRREAPTRIIEHRLLSCPECASRLGGVSIARRRQVIELPPPAPVEVREHVVYHGWCSQCQKWREAPLDVRAEVLGQGRVAREDYQSDCLPAHGDALTAAADPSVSGDAARTQNQCWGDCRITASAYREDEANACGAQSSHPCQSGGASR